MAPNINQNRRPQGLLLHDKLEAPASPTNSDDSPTQNPPSPPKSPVQSKFDEVMAKADEAISMVSGRSDGISSSPLRKTTKIFDDDATIKRAGSNSKLCAMVDADEDTVPDNTRRRPSDVTLGTGNLTEDSSDEEKDLTSEHEEEEPLVQNNRRGRGTLDPEQIAKVQVMAHKEDKAKNSKPRSSNSSKKQMPRRQKSTAASLPESIAWRVSRSWNLVADKTEKVGVDFFLRLFQEHPQAADLFRFGGAIANIQDCIERDQEGKLLDYTNVPKALKVHAKKVLDTVGVCVGGMSHLPDLVPTLRSLGKFHTSIGVQPFHYDAIYGHLLDAIESEVGSDVFDSQTRESWEIVYRSLTQVMKNPNNVLQMEPLEGWGTVATAACAYLTIVTPFQMAKLTVGNPSLEHKFNFLTVIAAVILALDMSSHWIANQVRPKGVPPAPGKQSPWRQQLEMLLFPLKFRLVRFLRSLQMDRWVQWHRMEATVLLSFPLQYANYIINRQANENPDAVGVHWTYAFGLLRLVAAHRVFHAFSCAENNFLLRKRQISTQELSTLRMGKLIVTMMLVVHINSALWCLVARMEFGPGNDPHPSEFFPLANQIFAGQLTVLNSYLHAVHWAWVNLAGIGDTDSKPETTLECFITLFVHICGATLYTITTGNVVNILEGLSAKHNEVGGDLAELGHFMQSCHVPENIQKRIMQGYMMKKMIGDPNGGPDQGGAEMNMAPKSPEAVARLPRHLEAEISLYYRAEAIRRRDAAFAHCSHDFLVAFVGSLGDPEIVLAEENYVHEGRPLPPQVALLVEGTMQVLIDGVCVRHLEAGDLIGKNHLFLEHEKVSERVGLMAETTCTLMTGLFSRHSVTALQKRFAKDFSLLTAYRMGHLHPQSAMNDFSGYDHDGSLMGNSLGGRRSSFHSLSESPSLVPGSDWSL